MPDHQITIGNVELISLNDGMPTRSPMMPFPDTTIEQWREFPGLVDNNDEVRSRYGTVAVRSGVKVGGKSWSHAAMIRLAKATSNKRIHNPDIVRFIVPFAIGGQSANYLSSLVSG